MDDQRCEVEVVIERRKRWSVNTLDVIILAGVVILAAAGIGEAVKVARS